MTAAADFYPLIIQNVVETMPLAHCQLSFAMAQPNGIFEDKVGLVTLIISLLVTLKTLIRGTFGACKLWQERNKWDTDHAVSLGKSLNACYNHELLDPTAHTSVASTCNGLNTGQIP